MTEFQNQLIDMMNRSMKNLKVIEQLYRQESDCGSIQKFEVYEVTQLANTFLCVLAYPWEKLKVEHSGKGAWSLSSSEMCKTYGFPELKKSSVTDKEPRNFRDLIRQLRNGLAHGHLTFSSDNSREIKWIEIWNEEEGEDRSGKKVYYRTWGTILSIQELRQFLNGFQMFAEAALTQIKELSE